MWRDLHDEVGVQGCGDALEQGERIDSGEWLPGEQIPSVRKITEEDGVSIGTARRAPAVL